MSLLDYLLCCTGSTKNAWKDNLHAMDAHFHFGEAAFFSFFYLFIYLFKHFQAPCVSLTNFPDALSLSSYLLPFLTNASGDSLGISFPLQIFPQTS